MRRSDHRDDLRFCKRGRGSRVVCRQCYCSHGNCARRAAARDDPEGQLRQFGEFEYTYPSREKKGTYTVKQIGDDLIAFIKGRYDKAFPAAAQGQGMDLGLLVG